MNGQAKKDALESLKGGKWEDYLRDEGKYGNAYLSSLRSNDRSC